MQEVAEAAEVLLLGGGDDEADALADADAEECARMVRDSCPKKMRRR